MASTKTHGNFVAQIIGSPLTKIEDSAFSNQGIYVSGIAPEADIYLNDVSNEKGIIYTSALIKAIEDATSLDVDILSISLGTSVYDAGLEQAVRAAVRKGILVFAASGNCGCRCYEFPSSFDESISVASMDLSGKPSTFNTRNDSVAVFAPGQNISVPGSKRLSGTSFAVPFASGVAALELQKRRKTQKVFVKRDDMIAHLRDLFGHNCDIHSYSNDVCTGRFMGGEFLAPTQSSYVLWPLSMFVGFTILLMILKYY